MYVTNKTVAEMEAFEEAFRKHFDSDLLRPGGGGADYGHKAETEENYVADGEGSWTAPGSDLPGNGAVVAVVATAREGGVQLEEGGGGRGGTLRATAEEERGDVRGRRRDSGRGGRTTGSVPAGSDISSRMRGTARAWKSGGTASSIMGRGTGHGTRKRVEGGSRSGRPGVGMVEG